MHMVTEGIRTILNIYTVLDVDKDLHIKLHALQESYEPIMKIE